MLAPAEKAKIPQFRNSMKKKWDRIASQLGGLTLVKTGEGQSSWMMVHSTSTFYEGVIIGQLGQVMIRPVGINRRAQRVEVPNDKKPLHKRDVEYTDDQIDQIIGMWSLGRSALELPFVAGVWGRDGLLKTRIE